MFIMVCFWGEIEKFLPFLFSLAQSLLYVKVNKTNTMNTYKLKQKKQDFSKLLTPKEKETYNCKFRRPNNQFGTLIA